MSQPSGTLDIDRLDLPSHHRALVLTSTSIPPTVQSLPIPSVQPGTAILRIIATGVMSYTREVYQSSAPGYRNYPFPLPIIPGFAAIGRIASVASDATALKPGQLVFFDPFVRARDLDGSSSTTPAKFLSAVHDGYTDSSKHFMAHGGVRDGSIAEYMRAMLENCYILNEPSLTNAKPQGLGYSPSDLCAIPSLLVPYGGLRSVDVRPGETVLISPATGPFGGAACMVALALGAKVIAWGRNTTRLASLKAKFSSVNNSRHAGMIDTVAMTDDAAADLENIKCISGSSVDVFFDISPPAAQGSHHIKTGILSLRHSGRVSLMGGFRADVPIPHVFVMHFDIVIQGKWMYERRDVVELIKLIERGLLVLGAGGGWEVVEEFSLDEWAESWDLAKERNIVGEMVVIKP